MSAVGLSIGSCTSALTNSWTGKPRHIYILESLDTLPNPPKKNWATYFYISRSSGEKSAQEPINPIRNQGVCPFTWRLHLVSPSGEGRRISMVGGALLWICFTCEGKFSCLMKIVIIDIHLHAKLAFTSPSISTQKGTIETSNLVTWWKCPEAVRSLPFNIPDFLWELHMNGKSSMPSQASLFSVHQICQRLTQLRTLQTMGAKLCEHQKQWWVKIVTICVWILRPCSKIHRKLWKKIENTRDSGKWILAFHLWHHHNSKNITYLFIYLFIYLCIYLFVFIYSFIHLLYIYCKVSAEAVV